MKWIQFNPDSINAYLDFIDTHANSGIWHYPDWLDFQLKSGRAFDGFFFGVEDHGVIKLAGLILFYKNSLKLTYSYIPGGFLYTDIDKKIYDFFVLNLNKTAEQYKSIFTQIDSISPYMQDFFEIISKSKRHKVDQKLPIPSFTNIIELDKNEEDILLDMKHKGRYNIKLAERKGVTVKRGDIKDFKKFYDILKTTSSRDGFFINEFDYYKQMIENIKDAVFLCAYHGDELLAAAIFTYTKNQALYYYGASSNNFRNLMAPYLLQWNAIKIAKEKKCKYFDFLGISDPDIKNDRLSGVTDFKLKFGGKVTRFNPSYIIVHNFFIFALYNFLRRVFKR